MPNRKGTNGVTVLTRAAKYPSTSGAARADGDASAAGGLVGVEEETPSERFGVPARAKLERGGAGSSAWGKAASRNTPRLTRSSLETGREPASGTVRLSDQSAAWM